MNMGLLLTGLLDRTTGQDYCTGATRGRLTEVDTGHDYWTGLMDRTNGLGYWKFVLDTTTGHGQGRQVHGQGRQVHGQGRQVLED